MPGRFEGSFARRDLVVLILESRRVLDGGIDIFEGDGEVDDVEVEVLNAPVLQLLKTES